MSASEISSPVRLNQRKIILKASVSGTMTIKLRMNLGLYLFSIIKSVKKIFLAIGLYFVHWGQKQCLSRSHICKKINIFPMLTYQLFFTLPRLISNGTYQRAGVERRDRSLHLSFFLYTYIQEIFSLDKKQKVRNQKIFYSVLSPRSSLTFLFSD